MNTAQPVLVSLNAGKEEPLEDSGFLSAINKKKLNEPALVTKLGLKSDVQSDKRFHGGIDKAIHQYAYENYTFWENILPDTTRLKQMAAFGENITSVGMTEDTVMIGDQYRLGGCILEVSQARQPCWKLNYRFKYPTMAEEVQNSLKTGWYYRVLEEGQVQEGDKFVLLERPYPEISLTYLLHILYKDCLNKEALYEFLKINILAESWKNTLTKRLETGEVEDWKRRLYLQNK
ncbi:MOSC domain-containing protein [Apibacter raozihei]|uniref:MOSC domain-containing protein n=1 Tax=Apibacter raozihei TaxID=2500547 RepID=UPI000FE42756|nr:MOSC domain-containing protein [Apibacter raozihei]